MNAKVKWLDNGRVELTFENGDFYRGDFPNNKITGNGYMRYANGTEYTGHFTDDAWDGYGEASWPDGNSYKGNWRNNLRYGEGKQTYPDGHEYDGNWVDDAWDGYGEASWPDLNIYKGFWKNSVREGQGTQYYSNGDIYEGSWKEDKWNGQGKATYFKEDGTLDQILEGTFKDHMPDGRFVLTWPEETVFELDLHGSWDIDCDGRVTYGKDHVDKEYAGCIYEGHLLGYTRHGKGKLIKPDGTIYEGNFFQGRLEGEAAVTSPEGKTEEVEYKNGNRVVEFIKDTERFLSVRPRDNSQYAPEVQKYFKDVIGMDSVKKQLDMMYKRFKIDQMRQQALGTSGSKQGYYFIITGNPGTGKTTVARIIGRMLHDLGILPNDTFVEVDRSKLVAQYIGQTAITTNEAIEKARGGTLFIDEAYSLYKKDDDKDFGKEAIDTLLKDMEDHRGEYCVIMAGYAKEMAEMVRNANPGLASRFDHKLTIDDYTPEELVDILITQADAKKFLIEKDAEAVILSKINKEKIDETFDNARFARRLLDQAIERQALRLSADMSDLDAEDLQILKAQDFGEEEKDLSDLDGCLEKLNSLTGLSSVKEEVNGFIRAIRIQNESKKRGLSIAGNDVSLNMVFTGNPGTGKTTVARLLGQIYYHLGMLKRPDVFVECVRADLVGRYQGETALKVKEVVRKALGGVLFIDEAYSLVMGENDSFGIEAVNTLVSEIENNRDKLAVIMAGYTKEMNEFLDSNPGLRSRLPKIVEFEDYSVGELMAIFRTNMKNRGYQLDINDEDLRSLISNEMTKKDFGNARGVRNICDAVITRQIERINMADLSSLTNEAIITIRDEDLGIIENAERNYN